MPINNSGYSSNQFLNIGTAEGATYGPNPMARTPQDNPDFLYPGVYIPNVYDDLSKGPLAKTPVQRGFIRGIFPEILNRLTELEGESKNKYSNIEPPVRRCFFQFNPSMILRSVQASSSTLNPLLQDPTQLLQAIPGQASFEFQLLFNREYEVSGQKYRDGSGAMRDTTPLSQILDNYGSTEQFVDAKNPENNRQPLPFKQDQVGDLGVLVDLYVLDSIIGQSITQDTVNSIRAYWQASRGLRGTGELDANGKPINPYATQKFLEDDNNKFVQGINNVFGNTAFLNPMPVRIVFSSLFMVEGFVTASNVAFHKFSENMVPTVCQVTLSVQALYIGFAKKDSYISKQLLDQVKQDIILSAEDETNTKVLTALLKKHTATKLANMGFSYYGWEISVSTGQGTYIPLTYIPPGPHSLNSWWQTIYNYNKATNAGIPFSFAEQTPSEQNTESLRFYTSEFFKEKSKLGNPKDLKITKLKLYFYDKAEIPSNLTDSELQRLSNTGKLNYGSYAGLTPIARCLVNKNNRDGEDFNYNLDVDKSSLDSLESAKLIEGTKADPYEVHWVTDDMAQYNFDEDRINKNPAKYFGDSVKILAQLTLQGIVSGAQYGDIPVSVTKTVIRDFDPNKVMSWGDNFLIDFDFLPNNNVNDGV